MAFYHQGLEQLVEPDTQMYHIVSQGRFSLWSDCMDYVVKQDGAEVFRTMNKREAELTMHRMINEAAGH